MKRARQVLELFLQFMKFGLFTFGGGWSIIAQMQKLYVEQEHTITSEELLDLTSVGRSLPGTMIGNVAMLYGYRVAGIAGSMACLFGMILPPMAILAVITQFYTAFQSNLWVAAAMHGIRAAVVPIMISAVIGMVGSAFRFPPCYAGDAAGDCALSVSECQLRLSGRHRRGLRPADCGVLRAEGSEET